MTNEADNPSELTPKQIKKLEKKAKKEKLMEENRLIIQQTGKAPIEDNGLFHTKKEPRKSMNTYLRNQNKVMVSSIAIADKKAAILIRINAAIVSGLVVFQNYINTNVESGKLISIILIVGIMISLILAILSAKPFGGLIRKFFIKEVEPKYPNLEENNFIVFDRTPLDEYEESMAKVLKSQDLQIGNQVRFNFVLSSSIGYKYVLLDWAYNIFLLSFIAVAIVFLVAKFT